MASIIAMRPLPAWTIFTLAMAIPVFMLEFAVSEMATATADRAREMAVNERANYAADIRKEFDHAEQAGRTTLDDIPLGVSRKDALAALVAAPRPFAIGFVYSNHELNIISGTLIPSQHELDALQKDDNLWALANPDTQIVANRRLSFNTSAGDFVTARSLEPDVVVGWLVNDAVIQRDAAPLLPHDYLLERRPLEEAVLEPKNRLFLGLTITDSKIEAKGIARPEVLAEEALTHITLGEEMNYRVARKPGEEAEFTKATVIFRKSLFGTFTGCLVGLVGFAAMLFARARGAQKLADLRTDFVAAVSHELRTPLASVRMFAELLEAGEVAEDERPEVEQALAGETRRLNATLDRMLRFGALSRGKLAPQKSKQKIAPILAEAAARAKDVVVEVDPEIEANIDGGLVGLALDNLLSNAKKYAPEGGPYLVRARGEKKRVFIDVVDKGPGLGWRARRLVWKPFERADARLSKATEGSGVGLALVRGIAEAHGGKATVVSKVGHGATFTLRLPRA